MTEGFSESEAQQYGGIVIAKGTGTCIACFKGPALEHKDVGALARLSVALHEFCNSASVWTTKMCGCHVVVQDADCCIVLVVFDDVAMTADAKLRALVIRSALLATDTELSVLRGFLLEDANSSRDVIERDTVRQQLEYDQDSQSLTAPCMALFEREILRRVLCGAPYIEEWFSPLKYAVSQNVIMRLDLTHPASGDVLATHLANEGHPTAAHQTLSEGVPITLKNIIQAHCLALARYASECSFEEGDAMPVVLYFKGMFVPLVVTIRLVATVTGPLCLVAYCNGTPGEHIESKPPPEFLSSTESVRQLHFTSYVVSSEPDVLPPDILGVIGSSVAGIEASFAVPDVISGGDDADEEDATLQSHRAVVGPPPSSSGRVSQNGRRFRMADATPDPAANSATRVPRPPSKEPRPPPPATRKGGRFARERLGEFNHDAGAALPPVRVAGVMQMPIDVRPPDSPEAVPVADELMETPSAIFIMDQTPTRGVEGVTMNALDDSPVCKLQFDVLEHADIMTTSTSEVHKLKSIVNGG